MTIRYFPQGIGITPASIKKSMDTLLEKDRVFQNTSGMYHILDPAIGYFIQTL